MNEQQIKTFAYEVGTKLEEIILELQRNTYTEDAKKHKDLMVIVLNNTRNYIKAIANRIN